MSTMTQACHASIGIILNEAKHILIASVPSHKVAQKRGAWEFPGGMIEEGETPIDALIRELQEEVGVIPLDFHRIASYVHTIYEPPILLEIFVVTRFDGVPQGLEGQSLQWVAADQLQNFHLLESNKHIIRFLQESKNSSFQALFHPAYTEHTDELSTDAQSAVCV